MPRPLLPFLGLLTLCSFSFGAAPPARAPATPPAPTINLPGLVARPLGPAVTGGRVTSLAVLPKNPAVQYVGTAGGGVWKTTDNGLTFCCVFEGRPNPSIGAMCLSPSNPNVVWVGTGEANARNSVSWGNGVFRSTDAGKTWQACGLTETQHIGKIACHPTDPETAYVAALGRLWGPNPERGVFKTTDGGKSWQHVLQLDPETGCIDVSLDPSDPLTVIAATYRVKRDGFAGGNPAVQFGPRSGLYRTRDAGKTWTRLSRGLPERPLGRIGLAFSSSAPGVVYAVIQTDRTDITQVAGQKPRTSNIIETGGIFRSADRGNTWVKLNDLCPRPFYFSQIRIDPQDGQRVYVLGIPLFVSKDGGRTFSSDGARNVHVDHHDLWIEPNDSDHLILGGDGGLAYSSTRGARWEVLRNLPIAQFYGIGLDSRQPYRVYGGLQDNGSWEGPSRTFSPAGITNSDWVRILGFDGFQCAADPTDPNTVFAEGQYGRLHRIDLRTNKGVLIRPRSAAGEEPNYRFNWNSPILISPHNPKTLYFGGNFLFRSNNGGNTWQLASADLTRGRPGPSPHTGHTLTTLAESPVRAGVLYTGSDDGRVCISKDAGRNWLDVSARLPGPAERWVTRVVCSPKEAGTAWLSYSRHRQDDRAPYLFKTEDFGLTWKPRAKNLPAEGPVHVVSCDPRNPELLYAGTEFGLFVSPDGGGSWQPLGAELPPAAIHDLAIHPRDRELVVATHGRSLFVLDVAPLQDLTPKVRAQEVELFEVRPAVLLSGRAPTPPARGYAAPNPQGLAVHYWLKNAAERVGLVVLDSEGRKLRELSCPKEAGLQRVVWDLRQGGDGRGELVRRGEYTVRLHVGGRVLERKVRVLPG